VSTDYDKNADFSKYSTFSLIPAKEIKSDLTRDRIEGAIATQLTAKGLKLVQGNANLLVAYHARLDKETQLDTTSFGYGWGGGWGGYYGPMGYGGYGGMGTSTTTVREIPVGTLIVDLVDASEKDGVAGVASDARRRPPPATRTTGSTTPSRRCSPVSRRKQSSARRKMPDPGVSVAE
jgi:hypothetical protein